MKCVQTSCILIAQHSTLNISHLLPAAGMFDSTSVIILSIMTVAFLLPVALSFLPFPTFLTPHLQPWHTTRPADGQSASQVSAYDYFT